MNEKLPSSPIFSNIRLIVLDLDGTLVDSFADITAAVNYALVEMGREPYDVPSVTRHVGYGARELMRSLLGQKASEAEVDRGYGLWKAYYLQHPADLSQPYPGVVETLKTLRGERGVRLAVLSNKSHELISEILCLLHLDSYFDLARGETPGEARKPDAAALLGIIEELGVGVDEALMVGDGKADILVGQNAGVATVGVDYGVTSVEDLERLGAGVVIGAFPELLDLLCEV